MENMENQKPSLVILYIGGTFVINIVCLNILISVVTDNYDIVIQRKEAEDCKYKAEKMLYNEKRSSFIRYKILKRPMEQMSEKFLLFARYYDF